MTAETKQGTRPRRRIGVLGAAGQVGRCVARQVESAPDLAVAFAVDREALDLADVEDLPARIDALLGRADTLLSSQ